MNDPIADQIVDTLTNLRRDVSTQGITAEADMLWQHALSLYRMRRDSPPANAGASTSRPTYAGARLCLIKMGKAG